MDVHPFTPLKLLRHSDRVEASLRGELTFPISVELDLSNTCPHDCPFCSFGTSDSEGYRQKNWVQFPVPRVYKLIDELEACGVKSVTLTGGGEPLVHRNAFNIIEKLSASTMDWGLVTNGFLLKGPLALAIAKGATFVRVSLDAGSAETHKFTHGLKMATQYDQIIANIKGLRADASVNGRQLTIGASFCVMDQNLKEIYKAAKDVRDAGGDYLEVRPTFPTEWRGDGWGNALSDVDAARTELEHAKLHLNSASFKVIGMIERFDSLSEQPQKGFEKCRIGPLMTVIGATGDLWHCCVQRGQEFFKIGDVLTLGFRDAWALAQKRRMADEIDVAKCPRCRYTGYNQLIEQAFLGDAMHAAFV